MAQEEGEGPLIKAATNEWVLLANRLFLSGSAGVLLLYATGIRDDTATLKREFVAYQIAEENRLGRLEGQMHSLEGSIEVHRKRLEGNDSDIRSLWARVYDIASGMARPKPNP